MNSFRISIMAIAIAGMLGACSETSPPVSPSQPSPEGERVFMRYCVGCHPNGGNIRSPQRGLGRMTLKANGITTVDGLVAKLRNPGGDGMPLFDEKTLPESDARAVAAYIFATFQ